jgi:hypothetical protein
MNNLSKSIATVGIWLAVAVISFSTAIASGSVELFTIAGATTVVIWIFT